MSLFEKAKEVIRTLLPVVILVLILCFTIIEVETDILIRFIVERYALNWSVNFYLV